MISRPDQGVTTAQDLMEILILNGGAVLYVNVHTSENPSGEIRGQLARQ